ncbi:uncharacterized protein [Clytia hemisphaerica]|uniref:uncharacterized protein n=1 Tax=Clytia hemisphaerica TaxID=252671 RepID=UPI0034D4B53E
MVGYGFWKTLRNTDIDLYNEVVAVERLSKRLKKCQTNLSFLIKCRDGDVYPKFVRWKNTRYLDPKQKKKIFRKNLLNEITLKHKTIRQLSTEILNAEEKLYGKLTFFRKLTIRHSLKCSVNCSVRPLEKKLNNKLDLLIKARDKINGITKNPNAIVTNLSSIILTNDEYDVLRFGLNQGLAMKPDEVETLAIAEDIWSQLYKSKLLKNDIRSIQRAKNSIRAFTFNLLDIDDKQIFKDSKHIKIIKNLNKNLAILKPDKGNGIVLLDKPVYRAALDKLFSDTKKFKKVDSDPTFTRLRTIQRYLNTIKKREEINPDEYKEMRPKSAKPARAHGLPKTHKTFETVPKFRPIIDTTGSTHYKVGKYLTKLLQPLTINDYTLKDSFDTATKIRDIPKELFDEGYVLVSFDVTSLFTNVPLQKTINVIIDRIYNKTQIETTLKKSTIKKLIKDTCTKTVFSCNDQLYEQIDGVSMGSSMGPLLANIIMTELEEIVVKPLIDNGTLRFYGRYVDDTLVLVKPDDIDQIHTQLNGFDKNIQFTVDKFENEVPHFLDIEISPDGLSVFRKDTNTGQYTSFQSYTTWNYTVAWMRSLVVRAYRICSENKFKQELLYIRRLASWNAFPRVVCNRIIDLTLTNIQRNEQPNQTQTKDELDNVFTVWLKVPYLGNTGQNLVKSLERKIRRNLKRDRKLVFKSFYSTTKKSFA